MAEHHYPDARRLELAEEISGHLVRDPYRWLEDPDSAETRDWLAAQDALFAGHAAALPDREAFAARIAELMRSGSVGPPVWRGDRRFFTRRTADQDHAVLFTAAPERVLIDPMALDPSGTTTLDAWQPDKEGELLAYQLSQGGDEESVLRVMDVATGQDVDGPIDRCRYSMVAWLPAAKPGSHPDRGPAGKAFYYVRRLAPETVPDGEEQYHRRVYLHRVGTPSDEDVMIFGAGREMTSYYGVSVSRDGRWLAISAALGTAPRNDLWLADLAESDEAAPAFRVVQEGVDARTALLAGRDGRLYVHTDAGAPRGRLALADPERPTAKYWQDLIAERADAVLEDFAVLDGAGLDRPQLLVSWTRHAISEITVHDLASGEQTGAVPLAGLGSIGRLTERPEGGHEAWFSYTDNTTPVLVQHYDGRTGQSQVWEHAPGTVEVPRVRTEQVTYQSKDGTPVRMLIISGDPRATGARGQSAEMRGAAPGMHGAAPGMHGAAPGMHGGAPGRRGAGDEPRSPRPAILNGYGGFSVSKTPGYSAAVLAWAEAGGVYAIASLRGGGEEGEEWHRAGMREHKQDVFDDFYAAAETLIADGWTTADQLAISGGSNGGLLVGVAVTQRPELFTAAICSAPLLDMVRYEKFGLGQTWNDEYGTASDTRELGWLLSYSPYHHVREGIAYPAVLFTTFDSDTRVDPMHARKMCAALQYAASSGCPGRPVLLRRESSAGHGARAVSRSVALTADTLAFAAFHTRRAASGKREESLAAPDEAVGEAELTM